MRFAAIKIKTVFLMGAGILWATLPDGPIPDIFWRLHFGGAMWLFGMMAGFSLGLWICHYPRPA